MARRGIYDLLDEASCRIHRALTILHEGIDPAARPDPEVARLRRELSELRLVLATAKAALEKVPCSTS